MNWITHSIPAPVPGPRYTDLRLREPQASFLFGLVGLGPPSLRLPLSRTLGTLRLAQARQRLQDWMLGMAGLGLNGFNGTSNLSLAVSWPGMHGEELRSHASSQEAG